jgi:hypothetical protein
MKILILRRPPSGPRAARPEDRLRGHLEGRTKVTQLDFQFRYSLETQNAYTLKGLWISALRFATIGMTNFEVARRFSAS